MWKLFLCCVANVYAFSFAAREQIPVQIVLHSIFLLAQEAFFSVHVHDRDYGVLNNMPTSKS